MMESLSKDGYVLWNGNSIDELKNIPNDFVDLTITSPPYDNLRSYNGNNDEWNDNSWKSIISDLFRVTKDGGVVVWIVADATVNGSETGTSFKQALFGMECGFNLHDTMIWCKDTSPFHMTNRYYQCFEYMFIFSKGVPKTFNQICDRKNKYAGTSIHGTLRNKDGSTKEHTSVKNKLSKVVKEYGSRFNYWLQPTEKRSKNFGHPAMFPLKLAIDHILSWSNVGDVVLDPFTGSGTTGSAAVLNNRKFIGIELDKTYFEIAKKRLSESFTLENLDNLK